MSISTLQAFSRWIAAGLICYCLAHDPDHETRAAALPEPGLIKSEFIFEQAPFRSAHASTLVETRDKSLVAAYFAGTEERALDVGIWISRHDGKKWSEPLEYFQGFGENGLRRHPCWNPVLFQPKYGPLLLFYKVGPSPENWWGMISTSQNQGLTWSEAEELPKNYYGPIRNKPVELPEDRKSVV